MLDDCWSSSWLLTWISDGTSIWTLLRRSVDDWGFKYLLAKNITRIENAKLWCFIWTIFTQMLYMPILPKHCVYCMLTSMRNWSSAQMYTAFLLMMGKSILINSECWVPLDISLAEVTWCKASDNKIDPGNTIGGHCIWFLGLQWWFTQFNPPLNTITIKLQL